MNLAKQPDTKSIFRNQRHFCTPTVKYQKQKSGKHPLDTATRIIKYPGINITKEVTDLYSGNYTTLKKEIKEDTNKWKHVPCYGLEELTSSKCPYYPMQFIDSM